MNLKKELGGVADAVSKIMDEALKGDQHKIDANKNNKIDAHDFKLLRAKKKVEEAAKPDFLDLDKDGNKKEPMKKASSEVKKEEVEQIDELSKEKYKQYLNVSKKEIKKHNTGSQLSRYGDTAGDRGFKQAGYNYQDRELNTQKAQDYAKKKIKEEVELTQDEAEMLASLSQEEFNSLTEEEQNLFIEYFQPLDEISTGAAKNYLKKAVSSSSKLNQKSAKPGEDAAAEHDYSHENDAYETPQFAKFSKRRTGIRKAINKLASAHPNNKKLATTARQAFNKMHNANYRIGMDGAKEHPKDVAHIKKQHAIIHKAVHAMKEAAERIDEYKSTGGVYKHKGTYGTEKSLEAGYTDYDKENELAKKNLKTKKPKKYGARQNFVRSTRVNESFTSILASYKENGLKGIAEMFATEQASQEEYEKEIEKAKAKSQGKDKAEVAKAAVQAVEVQKEQTHTKIEVVDMTDPYNIQKREIDLEERSMTEPEMKKKEEIVKSMKKGMKGFKERYGERAKEVMYATATKQAMKD